MRVISGKYKGKKLDGFDIDGTRPTMDRVKESLFGTIQNYVKDADTLDLFAGSGSLGIEALSMGANKCWFIDNNKIVINILTKNTKGIDNCEIIKKDYIDALKYFKDNHITFDLILLDPPYKLNLINKCLELIHEYQLLNNNGIIVCEFENENVETNYYEKIKDKRIANKCLKVYRRVD